MEAVGNDPTQAYLCAGVLQTLELSIAQRLHKSFSKIIGHVDFTIATDISAKRSAAQRSYYLLFTRYSEFLVRVGNFEIPTSSFQSQPSAFDNTP